MYCWVVDLSQPQSGVRSQIEKWRMKGKAAEPCRKAFRRWNWKLRESCFLPVIVDGLGKLLICMNGK